MQQCKREEEKMKVSDGERLEEIMVFIDRRMQGRNGIYKLRSCGMWKDWL